MKLTKSWEDPVIAFSMPNLSRTKLDNRLIIIIIIVDIIVIIMTLGVANTTYGFGKIRAIVLKA